MSHFLIIGGSSGISRNLAERLTAQEHEVTLLCRRALELPGVEHLQGDVLTDPLPECSKKIDGLVYCPGSINLKPFRQLTAEDFQNDFNINCLGAVRVVQHYLSQLNSTPPASVVFLSTVAVSRGMSFHASVAAAKGAVEGLTRSLAAELAPKVRVNCVAPSLTETPMAEPLLRGRETIEKRHPMQRIGQPEDVAAMIEFLLKPEASWITGQVIGVDGGLSTLSAF